MKLTAYLEIVARRGGEVTLHDVMSFIVQELHHASRHGRIALGFPNMGQKPGLGDTVRAFAEDIEVLNAITGFLVANPRVDDYALVRRPKPIPKGISEHVAFSYYRIGHGLSKARLARLGERGRRLQEYNSETRAKRANKINEFDGKGRNSSGIAFATLYSASTRAQFRLHVEQRQCAYSEGEPNGYGLSRKDNVVAIPVF
ncbi:MAG: type I-F CRISPR-associated endoribonuclease Cas6/Csy4 [Betaproteobacteria bacterium]|nr:type I-F CRISPR-associated endoribonuclease Cas6/Csy4 [Betaproteobacteria bacterium]